MCCSRARVPGCQQQARACWKNSHRNEDTGFYCSILFTIFRALQAFCLNLSSIFKLDKITIGKTNGLICGE